MKWLAAPMVVLLLAGCVPDVPLATVQEDAAGKQMAAPPSGMAALYVYEGWRGGQYTITVGQRTLGMLSQHNWMRVDLEPGRHDLRCAWPLRGTVDALLVDLAAGEVKYVAADFNGSCRLVIVPASVAQPAILAGKRVRELR